MRKNSKDLEMPDKKFKIKKDKEPEQPLDVYHSQAEWFNIRKYSRKRVGGKRKPDSQEPREEERNEYMGDGRTEEGPDDYRTMNVQMLNP